MVKISLKSALGHKRRLVGTAMSVIIGIAFLAGTFVFTDTLNRTFDNLFADVFEDTDSVVRSSTALDSDFGGEVRPRFDEAALPVVASAPGVTDAIPYVEGFARIIDKEGEPLGSDQGPPTFGASITSSPQEPWQLTDGGTLPSGADQMAMDAATAEEGDFSIGDTIGVMGTQGLREFTLSGIVRFADADSPGGTSWALFDVPTAQDFVGQPGQINNVTVQGEGSEEELTASINDALAADPTFAGKLEAITGTQASEESADAIQEGLSFFNILLLVFAGVALFVSAFIIYNTFTIIVAQRQRETALLRAVGASRRQVLGSVLFESVIVGLVASVVGLIGGFGLAVLLRSGLSAIGVDLPSTGLVLLPRTVIAALIVGVVVTVASAILPAIAASRTPPVAAMRAVALDTAATSRRRLIIGALVSGVGIALTVVGLAGELTALAFGIPLIFVGVFILGPVFARPIARLLGAPLPRLRGITGSIARENATRNPTRTARTAAALMVGVALVAGISVLAASVKDSVREIFGKQFTGDLVVTSSGEFAGLPTRLAEEMNEVPEIGTATGLSFALGRVGDGSSRTFTVIDPATVGQVFDLGFVEGAAEDLTPEGILVSESRAESDGLTLGSPLTVTFIDGTPRDVIVQGVYAEDDLAGPYTISKALSATTGTEQYDFSVFATVADGVSEEEAVAAVTPIVEHYPTGELETRSDYIESQASQIDMVVNLFYGLLALTVVIALIGIANTLSLSVYERTRELGLLRAVGMNRSQVRSSVRWESVITALLGTVQGIIIGILLGYGVIVALRSEGLSVFTVPVTTLVVVVLLAVVAGVVAAIRPARSAARLDILEAIATE